VALLAGCFTELPQIDAPLFACNGNSLEEGQSPCPATHFCRDGACRPRLDCIEPDARDFGCLPNVHRCELSTVPETSATECKNGVHTFTSSAVRDPDACACDDGLVCVGLAEVTTASTPAALPLYVFPTTLRPARLPAAELGAVGERALARVCTRACSSEIDCPAGHTCRAAAVLHPSTIAGSDEGRHTIGVCQPDILVTTSTPSDQVDPTICRGKTDCTTRLGMFDGRCLAQVEVILDHPARPADRSEDPKKMAWGHHIAIVPHCAGAAPSGTVPDGLGCSEDAVCNSGECEEGRCQRLCNPKEPSACGVDQCLDTVVRRTTGSGDLVDRLFLCR